MTVRRAAFIAGVVLLFAAWLLAGFWYGAPTAHAAKKPPYRLRVVERQMLSWTRAIFPAEDLIGTDCSRYGATYQCYVDVHDPSDGYLSHGFYDCAYRASVRRHALRVRVPETAYVLVARAGAHRGGVVCGHDLHPVSIAKTRQPAPDPGAQFTAAQERRAVAAWVAWSWSDTGLRLSEFRVTCATSTSRARCAATYRATGADVVRGFDAFTSCYTSSRVHRHRLWVDIDHERAWVHVGRSITPDHADGGLVCRHRSTDTVVG